MFSGHSAPGCVARQLPFHREMIFFLSSPHLRHLYMYRITCSFDERICFFSLFFHSPIIMFFYNRRKGAMFSTFCLKIFQSEAVPTPKGALMSPFQIFFRHSRNERRYRGILYDRLCATASSIACQTWNREQISTTPRRAHCFNGRNCSVSDPHLHSWLHKRHKTHGPCFVERAALQHTCITLSWSWKLNDFRVLDFVFCCSMEEAVVGLADFYSRQEFQEHIVDAVFGNSTRLSRSSHLPCFRPIRSPDLLYMFRLLSQNQCYHSF